MISTYVYALLAVVGVSLVSLIGVFTLSIKEEVMRKYVFLLVSLAVGALLGDAFIHLIPEAFEITENPLNVSLLIIAGILIFFVFEKFLHWHHHGDDAEADHIHPVGKLVIFSDAVHNFIDGVIIGISFMASVPLGVATTIAIILHEIPQEIGDFAVLLHAGYTRARALILNFLSALAAILGTLSAFALSHFGVMGENLINNVLPLAAGGFIYIAVADLIPELQKTKRLSHSIWQFISLILGVVLMVGLVFLE